MRRFLLAIAGLLLVSGCATVPKPTSIAETEKANIRTIVVDSFFGDSIRYQFVGSMVFTNKVTTLAVDWDVNSHIRDKLAHELGARYELKPTLSPYRSPGEGVPIDPAIQYLRDHYPPGYADAYVIVTYAMANDQIFHSNQYMFGMGLYGKGLLFVNRAADAYIVYYVTVVDGRSFSSLAEIAGGFPDDVSYNVFGAALGSYHIPYRKLDSSMAVDDIKTLTPAQKDVLHKTLIDLIDESLPLTLQREGLIEGPQATAKP